MGTVIWVGFLAGLVAGISPCVIPVLPGILVAGSVGSSRPVRRAVVVVLALTVTFAVLTLLGSLVLTALHLPDALLRWLGLAALVVVGLGLMFPRVQLALERPFARLHPSTARSDSHPVLLGIALGALFVPCAGPVLAAIALAGASGIGVGVGVLTSAFAVGVAVPLLVFALLGSGLGRFIGRHRRHARPARVVGGAVLLTLAVVLATDVLAPLQRSVPTYAQNLQRQIEDGPEAREALAAVGPGSASASAPSADAAKDANAGATFSGAASGSPVDCVAGDPELANCGPAPEFAGLGTWFNTPNGAGLTVGGLRGRVVLVDFWTFSCINCQNTLPFVTSWYDRYRESGLVVVGVHTPEFAFERDPDSLQGAISRFGIHYPVAQDNSSATWRAYGNSWWPAAYLIDANGVLRHLQVGEGGYEQAEQQIRSLLLAAHPGLVLPPPIDPAGG